MTRPVRILNSPCGVCTTTVAEAISDALLTYRNAIFDLDALAKVFPRPADDPFVHTLAPGQVARLLPALDTDSPLPLIRHHVWVLAPVDEIDRRLALHEPWMAALWGKGS